MGKNYIAELEKQIKELQQTIKEKDLIIEQQNKIILNKCKHKCLNLSYIVSGQSWWAQFDNKDMDRGSLWFVTLNADPKFIKFHTEEAAVDYYAETITDYFTEDDNVLIHGCFEHTKDLQIHVHFLIQYYDINSYATFMKKRLTHRLHLNYAVKVVKPNTAQQFEGASGVQGIYKYMAKEGYLFFEYRKGSIHIGRALKEDKLESPLDS